MAPAKRVPCQICTCVESKYTCAKCGVLYCGVPCYKKHRDVCSGTQQKIGTAIERPVLEATQTTSEGPSSSTSPAAGELQQEPPLRALASLRWPYVPEESAYPDPLKRDDPKPLQLRQYEAIATSPSVRRVIGVNPRLREILRSIDALRGESRELALQEALGVGEPRTHALASLGHASPEDRDALRQLAEAVEAAVRGGKQDTLGLDWGD